MKVKSRAFDIPQKLPQPLSSTGVFILFAGAKMAKQFLSLSGFELSKVVNQSRDWTIMNETISHPNSAMHLIVYRRDFHLLLPVNLPN